MRVAGRWEAHRLIFPCKGNGRILTFDFPLHSIKFYILQGGVRYLAQNKEKLASPLSMY